MQVLLAEREEGTVLEGFITRSNIEVAKLLVFNREARKVGEFTIACSLIGVVICVGKIS